MTDQDNDHRGNGSDIHDDIKSRISHPSFKTRSKHLSSSAHTKLLLHAHGPKSLSSIFCVVRSLVAAQGLCRLQPVSAALKLQRSGMAVGRRGKQRAA